MKINNNNKIYDYIIIGSGLGGLSVGSLLAQKNKKILILEKHYLIGGFATNFKRKGFEFDVSLHQTGGIYKTFYNKILKECGVFNKVKWLKHKYLFEKILNDNSILKVKNGDINNYKKQLYTLFPNEKGSIKFYLFFLKSFNTQLKIWEYLNSNYLTSPFIRILAPLLCPLVVFSHKIRVDIFFNRIKNKELKDILQTLIGYYKENSKDLMANPFFFAEGGYYLDGGYYVKGGGQELSNAFRKVIENNKGEVKILKDVDELTFKDNEIKSVITKKGEEFFANNFICNANPYEVRDRFLRKSKIKNKELDKYEIGMSFVGAYIGLNCPISKLSKKFKNSYEIFDKDMAITIHSNLDRDLCNLNNSTVDVFLSSYKVDFNKIEDKKDYEIEKEKLKEHILNRLEKHFNKIKDYVEVFEVATPKTVIRFTSNKNGAIYGIKNKKGQSGFDRIKFKDKNFKNLYYSSAYTIFGGGYEGAIRNGYYLYQKLIGNDTKRLFIFLFFILFLVSLKIFFLFYN